MDFSIENKISNFIENQFPSFYKDEGKNFILFMKTYYEWLESPNNPLYESRNLLNYGDIDNTLDSFLEYFQKKYIYSIPSNVIINKRFLLKHILDVYRSKSSIQGWKLIFRILYNEDLEVYLPGRDIIRVSDGTWIQPRYLEVTYSDIINNYVEKEIEGIISGSTAVVENFVRENFYRDTINTIYISNIKGNFEIGEKLVLKGQTSNTQAVAEAPSIIGSLNTLEIINGGQNFEIGNIIKIAKKDLNTDENIASGENGFLKVNSLTSQSNTITFSILNGGSGFLTSDYDIYIYNGEGDTTGTGANFEIGSFSTIKNIEYNTDLIVDYNTLTLDASQYNFPANATANATSHTLENIFSFSTGEFGTISSLTDINTGQDYSNSVSVFVRSTIDSNELSGTITYSPASANIEGVSTIFDSVFSNGDIVVLQANTSNNQTIEKHVIKEVVSSSRIILYESPTETSTASATYKASPTIIPANFATYEEEMFDINGRIVGENEIVSGSIISGGDSAGDLVIYDSGKGYVSGELVTTYLYECLATPSVLTGGSGYSNGEILTFLGGDTINLAEGFITTDSSGSVVSATLTNLGSLYKSIPTIGVKSRNGIGATFSTYIVEFNTQSSITGRVVKSAIGYGSGYWSTTRGHISSDKYIQDSFYYQDYSYELQVAKVLNEYKNILYNTFHTSGSELFGKYLKIDNIQLNANVAFSQSDPIIT